MKLDTSHRLGITLKTCSRESKDFVPEIQYDMEICPWGSRYPAQNSIRNPYKPDILPEAETLEQQRIFMISEPTALTMISHCVEWCHTNSIGAFCAPHPFWSNTHELRIVSRWSARSFSCPAAPQCGPKRRLWRTPKIIQKYLKNFKMFFSGKS